MRITVLLLAIAVGLAAIGLGAASVEIQDLKDRVAALEAE